MLPRSLLFPLVPLALLAPLAMGCASGPGAAATAPEGGGAPGGAVLRQEETPENHRAACERLFVETDMPRALDAGIDLALGAQIQGNPQLAPFEGTMREFFAAHMSWDALHEDFLRLYMESFTQRELEDLVAFYRTEAGRKSVSLMPELMRRGGEIGRARVEANMGDLQRRVEARARELSTGAQ